MLQAQRRSIEHPVDVLGHAQVSAAEDAGLDAVREARRNW